MPMDLEERALHLHYAETDPSYLSMLLRLVDDPDEGDVFFINAFCWTYDPRIGEDFEPIGDVPFTLWEAQEKAVRKIGRAMDRGHHLAIEKSRDQGVTWMVLACIVRRFLRKQGFSALIGAMTELLVDDTKNTDSLGWKIDKLLDKLPAFLLPQTFDKRQHRSWGNWVNPENGSSIAGRAPTARFAVGGRKTVIYFDDFAQWDVGGTAWQLAAASTSCRLCSFTVNPDNPKNHAWEIAYSEGKFKGTKTPLIPVRELHWSQDPRKQATAIDPATGKVYNVWKRQKLEDISEEQFSRDYEGVYEASPKGRIYANQMAHVRIGHFPFDPRFPLYTSWDFGVGDYTVIGFLQWDWQINRIRFVDCVVRSGQDTGYYLPFVQGKKDPQEILPYAADYDEEDNAAIATRTSWQRPVRQSNDTIEPEVVYEDHFGDPAGQNRGGASNKSPIMVLSEAGIIVKIRNDNAGKGYTGRINDTQWMLRHIDIDAEKCQPIIDALQMYRWNKLGTAPEHDEASHCASMVEFACVHLKAPFEEHLKTQRETRAIRQAERPGGLFYGGGTLRAALRDEEEALDYAAGNTYTRGSRSITGY